MNKLIEKLLKEMEEYGILIHAKDCEFIKRQFERAYLGGNIKGLKDAGKIYNPRIK